jgi:prevent-host-death family protein
MKEITTNELQDKLSKVIRDIETGETYQISRYSKSVAVILSKDEYDRLTNTDGCKKCVDDLRNIARKIKD